MKKQFKKRPPRSIFCIVIKFVRITSKVIFLFISLSIFGQRESDKTYTNIPYDVEGQDAPKSYSEKSFFWGSSFDYAVYEFSNILRENLNNRKEQQRMEYAKQQSLTKLAIIKNQYSEYKDWITQDSDITTEIRENISTVMNNDILTDKLWISWDDLLTIKKKESMEIRSHRYYTRTRYEYVTKND